MAVEEDPTHDNNNAAEQVESDAKVSIHRMEMPTEMKTKALEEIHIALSKHSIEKDLATYMKRKFDELYPGTTWHCIAGKGFGCSVAYDTQYLIFFQVGQMFFLLFKSAE